MALLRACGKLLIKLGKTLPTCDISSNQSIFVCIIRNRVGYVSIASKQNSSTNIEKCDYSIAASVSKRDRSKPKSSNSRVNVQEKNSAGVEILEEEITRLMNAEVESESDRTSSRLVGYCDNILASAQPFDRANITQQICNVLENKLGPNKAPTLEEYNALLGVFASYSQLVDPLKFLKSMTVPANTVTRKLLLNCAAKSGNVQAALYVLSLMKETGDSLNEEIFNSLIEVFARSGDVASARLNLERMIDAGIKPTARTWTKVAQANATVGDIEAVEKVVEANKKEMNDDQIMEIVETLILSNNGKYVQRMMKYLSSDVDYNNFAIVNAINKLAYAPSGEHIYPVVDRVTSDVASIKRDSFLENYLKTLVRAKTPVEAILRIIDSITENKDYFFAIMDVCRAALEHRESKLAMTLLEKMHRAGIALRPHYHWPLLIGASASEGEAGVFRIIKHMLSLDVRLDEDTFFYYVFPRINVSDVDCVLSKLKDVGLDVSAFVTPLVRYLLTEGNFESSLSLCSKYKSIIDFSKIIQPLSVAYKRSRSIEKTVRILSHAPRVDKYYPDKFLMDVFGKNPRSKDIEAMNKFIESFEMLNMPVTTLRQNKGNVETGNGKKSDRRRLVNSQDDFNPYNKIPHPRDMNVDELECHLIELRSKGMNKRGVLRKLLMEHCRKNNVLRVNELKKEYDENGYLWSSGLYSVLFQFYTRNDEIEEATRVYQLLREYHSHFRIDADKLLFFASALVKDQQIERAMEIIKTPCDASSASSSTMQHISKECWRLLDTVAHSQFPELTQNVLDILVKSGYCQISNATLGPVIRQHLLQNNVEEAVQSFKQFAEQYKCTPLRQELIVSLLKSIQKNDSNKERFIELLDEVQNIVTNIYGSEGLKVDLVLGLARTQMRKQLRQFFQVFITVLKNPFSKKKTFRSLMVGMQRISLF